LYVTQEVVPQQMVVVAHLARQTPLVVLAHNEVGMWRLLVQQIQAVVVVQERIPAKRRRKPGLPAVRE
jgi:hypothetical protein